ncbi:MAG: hypothetical protein ACI85E_002288, partial [Marinomonas primoryensis]
FIMVLALWVQAQDRISFPFSDGLVYALLLAL